jgi:hypothetical protein
MVSVDMGECEKILAFDNAGIGGTRNEKGNLFLPE